MNTLFICVALTILLLYSLYFYSILSGKYAAYEDHLRAELMLLRETLGARYWRVLFPILGVTLCLEIAYFISGWMAIDNNVFRMLTIVFAGFEVFHSGRTLWFMKKFIQKKIDASKLLNWRLERITVLSFYVHAVLGILLIILP